MQNSKMKKQRQKGSEGIQTDGREAVRIQQDYNVVLGVTY